jgi:hypothetical protein
MGADELLRDTIREHHERITDPSKTEFRVNLADVGPGTGPVRLLNDTDTGELSGLLAARPAWWDHPSEIDSLRSLGDRHGVPAFLVRYDPETLEPLGEPEAVNGEASK